MEGAAFERLCGEVLRKRVPELANLLPSGINSEGRTIKSLSDGFCFVQQNHYATVHVTTNSSDLRKKWLYNGNAKTTPKGDLIKGIEQARTMVAAQPDCRFTIYLVSNRRVEDDLHVEVYQQVIDDFIEVKIVEQRDLISFLDFDPDGQYLRKHFLGIDAERISTSLLNEILELNLSRYSEDIFLEASHLATTANRRSVETQLSESSNCINLLTGESGFGKSTLCYALMKSYREEGKVALRIKPSVLEMAVSLEEAIRLQLKGDYSQLYVHEQDIRQLFPNALVVIDDINRTPALLDKVIAWNRSRQPGAITVLCPVWPGNLAALDNKIKKEYKYTSIPLKRLSFYDCKKIIQQRIEKGLFALTDQEMHSIIVDTGFDPLLLDFSLQLLANTGHYTESIASEAIKRYVSDKVMEAQRGQELPAYLIRQTLVQLGKEMLLHRKLEIHFRDIESWMGRGSEEYQILARLGAQRQVFSFDGEGNCHFRHDRVRDYLLIQAAVDLFGDCSGNRKVLAEPYFSEIVGAAIAAADVSNADLASLMQQNPLAVYQSLKYLQGAFFESKAKAIATVIGGWISSAAIKRVPKTVTDAIAQALMTFDVEHIQLITDGLRDSAELQLAKFRNGNWLAGVNFFSFIDYFYPEAPTYWWNSILAHVKAKQLDRVVEGLHSFLPHRFTPEGIVHAYTLAGFLEDRRLLEVLPISWEKYKSPKNYPAYLWAILKLFSKEDHQLVADVLSYWTTLSTDEKKLRLGERLAAWSVEDQLRALNWNFSEQQLSALIELTTHPDLEEILSLLLTRIDHPVAIGLLLNREMQRDQTMPWHDHSDNRWDYDKTRRRLSEASLDYLQQEFSKPDAPSMRRYLAWRYWTGNVEVHIALPTVQEIISERDSLFEDAVIWRVRHGDGTALESIKQCIVYKPWLVRTLHRIWSLEVCTYFEDWLVQRLENKEELGWGLDLLSLLDNKDASRILAQYWEQMKWHPKAIETALYLATPETRALADKEIRRLGFDPSQPMHAYYKGKSRGFYFSDQTDLSKEQKENLLLLAEQFRYLYMQYGNKYEGMGERLTREKLESLLPYLPLFDSHSIYEFAQDSLRIGAQDLCYEKFYPLLEGHLRKRIRLTLDDLKEDITDKYQELQKEDKVHIDHWTEEVEKQGIGSEVLDKAVQCFYEKHHNAKAFFIGALILERLGTRKSISIMENFNLESEAERQNLEYWKSNAIFSIHRRTLQ